MFPTIKYKLKILRESLCFFDLTYLHPVYCFRKRRFEKFNVIFSRFKQNPQNYAMYKSKLTKDRAHAVADGNYEESDRLDALLLELEEKAEQLDQVIILRNNSKTLLMYLTYFGPTCLSFYFYKSFTVKLEEESIDIILAWLHKC